MARVILSPASGRVFEAGPTFFDLLSQRRRGRPADLSIHSKIHFCVGKSASAVVIKQVSLGETLLFSSFRGRHGRTGHMTSGHMTSHMTVSTGHMLLVI